MKLQSGQRLVRAKARREDIEDRTVTMTLSDSHYPEDTSVFLVTRDADNSEKYWVYFQSEEFEPISDVNLVPELIGIPQHLVKDAYHKRP